MCLLLRFAIHHLINKINITGHSVDKGIDSNCDISVSDRDLDNGIGMVATVEKEDRISGSGEQPQTGSSAVMNTFL